MVNWLVDGLIPEGHAVLLLGERHAGKAWLAEQLAVCVASGTRFLDAFNVCQQPVILIDEDSGTGSFKRRFYRLARGLDIDLAVLPLMCYSRCGFLLWDDSRRRWLINLVKQQKGKPLVIIDSMEKVMSEQEVDGADVKTQAGDFWHELRDAGATVLMVHQMSMKKKIHIEDWDVTRLALNSTMLVEGCDTAIVVFRAPTTRTEFVIKPEGRKVRLKVNRPFSVVLQENERETWAKLVLLEDLIELSGEAEKRVLPQVIE
ncbi:MAG: AAA family ATPase [Dehalococcoidia bacterium]|nr:AAA family ATPase [Dehalococcoidia bacterium]